MLTITTRFHTARERLALLLVALGLVAVLAPAAAGGYVLRRRRGGGLND